MRPLFASLTASDSTFEYVIALGILCGTVPITVYLAVSFIHQTVFRRMLPTSCTLPPTGGGWFTKDTEQRLEALRDKHWGSISSKVIILGILYLVMQVIVSKGVVVFLSGLNALLAPMALGAVLFIFLAVGLAMFLIPVIPGVPVYICAGVMIPWNMMSDEEKNSTDPTAPSSFWNGLVIACALSCTLKFFAIAVQQEVIGRKLGQRVAVRAACGINSSAMRSIRVVLESPGLTFDKSVILVGGPDWPTSVATGIMGLSLPQMLLGSVPVLLLIVPSVMLGAFQLMQTREGWEVMSDMITLAAMMMQLGAMVGFAAVVERASVKYADELAALPYDEEVRVLDKQEESFVLAWRVASDWRQPDFPKNRKAFVIFGGVMIVFGFHLSLAVRCFERVAVSDQYANPPISSNPLNVVRNPGWALLLCFFGATVVILNHRSWLTKRSKELVASGAYDGQAQDGIEKPPTTTSDAVSSRCLSNEAPSAPSVPPMADGGEDSARGDSVPESPVRQMTQDDPRYSTDAPSPRPPPVAHSLSSCPGDPTERVRMQSLETEQPVALQPGARGYTPPPPSSPFQTPALIEGVAPLPAPSYAIAAAARPPEVGGPVPKVISCGSDSSILFDGQSFQQKL